MALSTRTCSLQRHPEILRRSKLGERAPTNTRLVTVFGIDNPFTTTDERYHREFLGNVRLKLQTSDKAWKSLADASIDSVGDQLTTAGGKQDSFLLIDVVRITVFRTVMTKFFPDVPKPTNKVIKSVTSKINDLWVASKSSEGLHEALVTKGKEALLDQLREVFLIADNQSVEGRDNPLNILLPAYETLWRIVFRLFLEVRFRSNDVEIHEYMQLCHSFFDHPNYASLEDHRSSFVSLAHIVKEGLRLYPPTRTIYRQIAGRKERVGVETLQRNSQYWGSDALKFYPSRFVEMRLSSKVPYLPFGAGSFECPAKNNFGPVMIGVLLSSLVLGVGREYRLSGPRAEDMLTGNAPLENGRVAYEELFLQRFE
ncbi:hypothetical protein BDZ45DRAFT_656535 [Acephala macrosclerotiorum]|nr:hypothetical protein BDZ45DRAFT_656535 [Acephala macrosclerotiorum]